MSLFDAIKCLLSVLAYVNLPNSHVSPVKGGLQLHLHVSVSRLPPLLHFIPLQGAEKKVGSDHVYTICNNIRGMHGNFYTTPIWIHNALFQRK